jgi:hypothetical protein
MFLKECSELLVVAVVAVVIIAVMSLSFTPPLRRVLFNL